MARCVETRRRNAPWETPRVARVKVTDGVHIGQALHDALQIGTWATQGQLNELRLEGIHEDPWVPPLGGWISVFLHIALTLWKRVANHKHYMDPAPGL